MLSQTPASAPSPNQPPRQPVPPAPFTGTAPGLLAPHQAEILSAFLRGMSILELSRASSIPLPQLLAFLGSPEAQAVIADFENVLSLQWRLISLGAQAQAIRALERVCDSRNSPAESRRAATEILRLPECRTAPPARTRTRSDADNTSAANRISVHHNTANSSPTNQSPANLIPERANPSHTQPASDSRVLSETPSPMGARVGGGGGSASADIQESAGMHANGGGDRRENTSNNAPIPAPSTQFIRQATLGLADSNTRSAHPPIPPSTASQPSAPGGEAALVQSPPVQHPAQPRSPELQPHIRIHPPMERLVQSAHDNASLARNPQPAAISHPLPDPIPKVA